jgi:O-antigen/teichoic acid export membrane protein
MDLRPKLTSPRTGTTMRYSPLIVSVLATFCGRLALMGLALVLSTILLHQLGAQRYGAWSLFLVFLGSSSVFDFGLGTTIERIVAGAEWRHDREEIERTLNTGATLVVVVTGILQAAILLVRPALMRHGQVDSLILEGLVVLPVCLLMTNLSVIPSAGLAGIQQMVPLNAARAGFATAASLAVVALVAAGVRRIDVLLLTYSSGSAPVAVLCWHLLGRRVGRLRFRPWTLDRTVRREFTRFGGRLQVASLAPQLADNGLRIVLGARFGASAMGYFDLGSRAALVPRSAISALFVSMVPFGVREHLAEGAAGLSRLHHRAVRYTCLFILPVSALVLLESRRLVELWIGPGVAAESVLDVLRVYLVMHALGAAAAPATMIGRAVGRIGPEVTAAVVGAILGVSLAAVLPSFPHAVLGFATINIAGALAVAWVLCAILPLTGNVFAEIGGALALASGTCFAGWALGVILRFAGGSGVVWELAIPAGTAALLALMTAIGGVLRREERRFWIDVLQRATARSTRSLETEGSTRMGGGGWS